MQTWHNPLKSFDRLGEIEQCIGLKIVANGPPQTFIGEICDILDLNQKVIIQAEVVGFDQGKSFLMPLGNVSLRSGYKVRATGNLFNIFLGNGLLGRVVDAFAKPLDDKGSIPFIYPISMQEQKINPLHRAPIKEKLRTGIHAIDGLLPIGKGQRVGIFAGSGVGKSVLLGMIAKNAESEVNVIALIGERGREVLDFIENNLDDKTLKKSVLVIACSDESALVRRQAVYTATTIAEFFCQQGKNVMLFMDSITRFAMAHREISLSLGEPPTSRGYTPSVFARLPPLLERAGNFKNKGSISAIYTVLVEGDDFNEPIADTMRSLLDGHIVLTRELAHRGHYPAIDILQSISRLSNQLSDKVEQIVRDNIIAHLSLYQQHKELIELGAYKPGNHPDLDKAIEKIIPINTLLKQKQCSDLSIDQILARFKEIAS